MRVVPRDVVVLPESHGRWVVLNLFARSCLALESAGLDVLRAAESASDDEIAARFRERSFRVWNVARASFAHGLMSDPTPYERDSGRWGAGEDVAAADLIARCQARSLLVVDEAAYARRFGPKTSPLDAMHFGNLHDQLGAHLILRERVRPDDWWAHQKFEPDLRDLKPTLYRSVQKSFLERFFADRLSSSDRVLDVGCGVGFYTNLMAAIGATVVGVDPNAAYVAKAQTHAHSRATFVTANVGYEDFGPALPAERFTTAFMCDAMLFYFVPPVPTAPPSLDVLLSSIRAALVPGGRLIVMEPHASFFLMPWLGAPERPFTAVTEYSTRSYGITGTLSGLVNAVTSRGFVLTGLHEPEPTAASEALDPRAYHFARQFPLWYVLDFRLASA